MPRVVSIHEYEIRPDRSPADFEAAVRSASEHGLFSLPGLESYTFLDGIKGDRQNRYAAVWTYESREAWEQLWGPVENPVDFESYPERWQRWETEHLDDVIVGDPDDVTFTSYEEMFVEKP